MAPLEIRRTYSVGDQVFSAEADAHAYIASVKRRTEARSLIEELSCSHECRGLQDQGEPAWVERMLDRCDARPLKVLLLAGILLQGRDAGSHAIPCDLALQLEELRAAQQEEQW